MRGQERRVIPRPRADELRQGAHLAGGIGPRAQEAQRERLDVLARHVGGEQAPQVHRRPVPLLPAGEQRREMRVVGGQLLAHLRQIRRRQRHERRSDLGVVAGARLSAVRAWLPSSPRRSLTPAS